VRNLAHIHVPDHLSMLAMQSDLVKRARGKALAPDEYNSGNFTISNLGMFGAESFDAILPPGGDETHNS